MKSVWLTAGLKRRALPPGCAALLALALFSLGSGPVEAQAPTDVRVLTRAHAHNDYEHVRPLLDALDQGFNSVEADVHLVDGELYVAHDRSAITPDRTLEALYLSPLRERVRRNGGRVYRGAPPLLLLIDIKTDSTVTYARLDRLLSRYSDLFTRFANGAVHRGPVVAIISGNRPEKMMRGQSVRFAAFDGRLPDLSRSTPLDADFMPLVSESWTNVSHWNGTGAAPDTLAAELRALAGRAHEQGRRLRFWGSPDTEAVWKLLFDAGVDLINTDDLSGLRAFLLRAKGGREFP